MKTYNFSQKKFLEEIQLETSHYRFINTKSISLSNDKILLISNKKDFENNDNITSKVYNIVGDQFFPIISLTLSSDTNLTMWDCIQSENNLIVVWTNATEKLLPGTGTYVSLFDLSKLNGMNYVEINELPSNSPIQTGVAPSNYPVPTPTISSTPSPSISPSPFTVINFAQDGEISGTTGRDRFVIEVRNARITGGEGNDEFIFEPNSESEVRITDFEPENEKIDLKAFDDIGCFDELTIREGSVIIEWPDSQSIILENLSPTDIDENNFFFIEDISTDNDDDNNYCVDNPAICGGIAARAHALVDFGVVGAYCMGYCSSNDHNSEKVSVAGKDHTDVVQPDEDV